MLFSDFERVIYKKCPLREVVCQLRFPRILVINEKEPMEFQEKIRNKFPSLQIAVEQLHMGILQAGDNKNYRFSSNDEKWHVNLTSTFLALSTTDYKRWESFLDYLKEPLSALLEIYKPAFYERIGLRYIDAFKLSELGLVGMDWTELIHPFALGFMSNPKINKEVKNQNTFVELDIGDGAIAQINIAKGFMENIVREYPVLDDEESFIVDSDMFVMRKQINELDNSLKYLHDYAAKFIRAIITDKLHNAMEPSKI
ncbi:MAG: TIGR04255 family protein [Fibromonadaceae bacterium]|jgi:uncharacterized protein (TIGR04255 family)|nr:TIGR04255 family protein [Fibromonadaceae bacterium]